MIISKYFYLDIGFDDPDKIFLNKATRPLKIPKLFIKF